MPDRISAALDAIEEANNGRFKGWHLDKRVPLGLIVGLFINMATGIWFASKLDSRVAELERSRQFDIAAQHERDDRQDHERDNASQALIQRLDRLDSKLDRIIEREGRKRP